jgi:hypothetical protein
MSETVEILEDLAEQFEALKQKCFDSIRKIKEKEGFNSSSARKGKRKLGAYDKRRQKLQNQSS